MRSTPARRGGVRTASAFTAKGANRSANLREGGEIKVGEMVGWYAARVPAFRAATPCDVRERAFHAVETSALSRRARASVPRLARVASGARRRRAVDVAGKTRCETVNAGPDGRVRQGVMHSPAGARTVPDEPRLAADTIPAQATHRVFSGSTGTRRGDDGAAGRSPKHETPNPENTSTSFPEAGPSPLELDRFVTSPPLRG